MAPWILLFERSLASARAIQQSPSAWSASPAACRGTFLAERGRGGFGVIILVVKGLGPKVEGSLSTEDPPKPRTELQRFSGTNEQRLIARDSSLARLSCSKMLAFRHVILNIDRRNHLAIMMQTRSCKPLALQILCLAEAQNPESFFHGQQAIQHLLTSAVIFQPRLHAVVTDLLEDGQCLCHVNGCVIATLGCAQPGEINTVGGSYGEMDMLRLLRHAERCSPPLCDSAQLHPAERQHRTEETRRAKHFPSPPVSGDCGYHQAAASTLPWRIKQQKHYSSHVRR